MSKLPHVGTTIFTVMSKLANDTGAINLSQGFPNFPVDKRLTDILAQKATEDVHQYMPMPGSLGLRTKIAELIHANYNRSVSAETEVLVTAGATQAIFTAIIALVHNQQEVIILDPAYDCYDPAIQLAGGIPKHVSLDDNYRPDWAAIEAQCNDQTRMIITNNPHNPSGKMWTSEDFERLEALMDRHKNLIWFSDEVYEFISFDSPHVSAHQFEQLRERILVCSSFGKTFHITGWKMGYLIAPVNLMQEVKKVHQFNVFSVNSVAQACLESYLDLVDVKELGEFYKKKRDLFISLMSSSRFKLLPCDGTYFQLADYSAISTENDVEFCKRLAVEFGVAAIPVSVFNTDGKDRKHIRFCFAKDDTTLINATEKLCKI